jgi:pimeloyl-ACP methyl ester carboxylesterase
MHRTLRCVLATILAIGWTAACFASEVGAVVIHGKWGMPDSYVSELAAALRGQGFLVAVPEMPWSRERTYDRDVASANEQVDTEIAQLQARGAKRLFVIGHSLGANYALHYAARAPAPLAGVIAIAPGHRTEGIVFRKRFGIAVRDAQALVAARKSHEAVSFTDINTGDRSAEMKAPAAVFLSYFDPDGPFNMQRNVENVKRDVPVLWVVPTGEEPPLRKSSLALFSSLPRNRITRLAEPASDHVNAPGASAKLVIDWIREVTKAP